ncbi:MAG: sigma-70 family RNA polymerase sigma factor [Polyangiaceae bacterium]|nr:sigma-70 family RNA polymerase sigma factor [Polyangiaceae bacterium]
MPHPPCDQPVAGGSEAAREARLRRMLALHFDAVWRTACRLGATPARADDVAQEAFLVASRKLEQVDPQREREFLMGVAVRLTANVRRAIAARAEVSSGCDAEAQIDPTPGPDELLERKRLREVLDSMLRSMPDDQRDVFVLCEIEGMSGPEAAVALDMPLGTVASRLHRARARFHALATRYRSRCVRAAGDAQ